MRRHLWHCAGMDIFEAVEGQRPHGRHPSWRTTAAYAYNQSRCTRLRSPARDAVIITMRGCLRGEKGVCKRYTCRTWNFVRLTETWCRKSDLPSPTNNIDASEQTECYKHRLRPQREHIPRLRCYGRCVFNLFCKSRRRRNRGAIGKYQWTRMANKQWAR